MEAAKKVSPEPPSGGSQGGKVSLTFEVYDGDTLTRSETLTQDIIKIGKLPSSHLRIDDDAVSRMHAVIEVSGPDQIHIIDLGSASGTIVNGKKVNKCALEDGDELTIGSVRVVVRKSGAAVAAESPNEKDPFASRGLPLEDPFAPASVPPAEDAERYQYGIVATGDPIDPSEVETTERSLEVVVMWGERSVLHVAHMTPPRSFYVGEVLNPKEEKETPVDFTLGSETLGLQRLPIVLESSGDLAVVVPEGASGGVTIGQETTNFDGLRAQGKLQPCSEVPGAAQYRLTEDATVRVVYRGFTFVVKPVRAGKRLGGGFKVDRRPIYYVGGSLLIFVFFLTLFYFLPPQPASISVDLLSKDSHLVQYLKEVEELKKEEEENWLQGEEEGGQGERHQGDEGEMGKEDAPKTNKRYAVKGPQDNPNPQLAREQAKEQARNAGILGTLAMMQGAFDSPTSPFGADSALGTDAVSALGAMMGAEIGESGGFGGLGLRGTGRGGGGTGAGTIGLGNFGRIGHGSGRGTGSGYGDGVGHVGGRKARVPRIRQGTADVRGSLSKEVIRRIIRRHLNEVKFCYEQELQQRPDLEGRVTITFIISATGAVQSSVVASSSLGSQPAELCIAQAVRRWTFPSPDGGGTVIVNYPFLLAAPEGG